MPRTHDAFNDPSDTSDDLATALSPYVEGLLGDGYTRGELLSALLIITAELMSEMSQKELREYIESLPLFAAGFMG
jgi:hypothetical protein